MIFLKQLFEIQNGNGFALSNMEQDERGCNFISRSEKNNGISGRVKIIPDIKPFDSNQITVALSGSVLSSFYQTEPFYTAYHIKILKPKQELTPKEMLFYCLVIKSNKYRYSYGRQANRTLDEIQVPSPEEIPDWIQDIKIPQKPKKEPVISQSKDLWVEQWKWFDLNEVFDFKKGSRLTRQNIEKGETPFIGAIDSNNGYREFINKKPLHQGNTITVNYNGSVAEAFYQPKPFWASDDVNVLYPKFELNIFIGLFIVSLIKREKYRFGFGRKWHIDRMEKSKIKLPIDKSGKPDWQFMEEFTKSLPYSSNLKK